MAASNLERATVDPGELLPEGFELERNDQVEAERLLCLGCRKRDRAVAGSVKTPEGQKVILSPLCPECQEAQAAETARAEERAELDRIAARKRALPSVLHQAGVNTRQFRDLVDLAQLELPECDAWARRFAWGFVEAVRKDEPAHLYLWSRRGDEEVSPGGGKTHLVVTMLREILKDPRLQPGRDVRFAYVPEILLRIKDAYGGHGGASPEAIRRQYVEPRVLVWDDFGAHRWTDWAVETIGSIVYEREGKQDAYTANFSLDHIAQQAAAQAGPGDQEAIHRILSRVSDEAWVGCMTGPDRRRTRELMKPPAADLPF